MVQIKKHNKKAKCSLSTIVGGVIILAIVLAGYSMSMVDHQYVQSVPSHQKGVVAPSTMLAEKNLRSQSERSIPQPKLEPPKPVDKTNDGHKSQIHVVFSTSCSYSHDWQAYLFFFHAYLHEQPGDVTRIVSGCSDEQEVELSRIHQEQIAIMSNRFYIHFTPEFGKVEGLSWQTTKYWNKPFGIKHFLENKFGYKYEGDISTPYDEDIVILVDPDMLMQRPFTNDFSGFPKTLWHNRIRDRDDLYDKVGPGRPIAQTYSFGDSWLDAAKKGDMTKIVGPDSPALNVSDHDAEVTFSAGPPYMLTARDMYRLAYHWAKFLPGIQENFNGMMAEMYGYCTAAAHLNLRHQIASGLMVSNIGMTRGEGWEFLNGAPDDVCDVEQFRGEVPQVIHFCQRYSIGEFFLSKYKVPNGILSCDHQLFELPPKDIAAYTNYSHFGDHSVLTWSEKQKNLMHRNAFMVCSLMPAVNKAATFWKNHNCPDGANYNETWNHFTESKKQGCKNNMNCPL